MVPDNFQFEFENPRLNDRLVGVLTRTDIGRTKYTWETQGGVLLEEWRAYALDPLTIGAIPLGNIRAHLVV